MNKPVDITHLRRPKPVYPTKAQIRRAVDAARENGIKVGGFELRPDGTITILPEKGTVADPAREAFFANQN